MKINILDKLNTTCEILGLIYLAKNYDILIKEAIKSLDDSGINGQLFVKKNLKILDKYVKEFKKNMILEEEHFIFSYEEEDDFNLFLLIASIMINYDENKEYYNNLDEYESRKLILETYCEMKEECNTDKELSSLNDIFVFIERQEINDKNKWNLMKILSHPKDTIETTIKIIENNKKVYEDAYNSIENQLLKLISNVNKYISSGECEVINNLINNEEEFVIVPTLVFGMAIFEMKNTVFVGVLVQNLYKEQLKAMGNKGELVLKLKALSDNSKLETISLLKKGPKYSLEIAENLNLTSATVSYHMSTLLEIGLVSAEKKQGKVYYYLNEVAIEKFIEDLKNTLL